jgi:hypothetical protein
MNDNCPVCSAKSLGAAKIRACNMGSTTPYVVAAELGCSFEQVMTHINESHEIQVDADDNLQSPDALLNRLMKNMNTLKEWTDFVIGSVATPKDVDRAKVDMLVKLTQEIRKTVESIAELQGRKGPGDTIIQLQTLNMKVIQLTNTVVDVSCPECKMKILAAMERQQLVGGDLRCGTSQNQSILLPPVRP